MKSGEFGEIFRRWQRRWERMSCPRLVQGMALRSLMNVPVSRHGIGRIDAQRFAARLPQLLASSSLETDFQASLISSSSRAGVRHSIDTPKLTDKPRLRSLEHNSTALEIYMGQHQQRLDRMPDLGPHSLTKTSHQLSNTRKY